MAEAEDVLIGAAEWVSTSLRARWRRGLDGPGAEQASLGDARRRIATWLLAATGRVFDVRIEEEPLRPGPLARALGRLAPWQLRPAAAAWCDGEAVHVPRSWLDSERGSGEATRALLAALVLGTRVARGSGVPGDAEAVVSDIIWCLEGALAEGDLARAWPGLAPQVDAERCRARQARPGVDALAPAERAVEGLVRRLLEGPAGAAPFFARELGVAAPDPEVVRAFAVTHAAGLSRAGYRGVAPVPHWGAAGRPTLPSTGAAPRWLAPSLPTRRLRRRPRPRAPEPSDPRPGPFVLPAGDPHLAVQDAAGLVRPRDRGAEEDLDALAEELARQESLSLVRDPAPVREVLEGEARPSSAPSPSLQPGADAAAWLYPEWDLRARAYHAAACRVVETAAPAGDAAWAARIRQERRALLARLRRRFEALRLRRVRLPRQIDGDDLDLGGWVEEWSDRRAGRSPPGRIYTREQARRREVAVALLVDASGSTDAWVSGPSRVIDVAREAALCFCEALAALGDRHAVYAFSSRGPRDVRVWRAKAFDEGRSPLLDARLAGLAPYAGTRLGAALRHVTARLLREPARARLLLVLSDGKPNDEDRYEGAYGIEDVRQAVAEARGEGVRVFCATIDRAGSAYLPRMFGATGFTVLRDVRQLPERLPDLHRRLTAGA